MDGSTAYFVVSLTANAPDVWGDQIDQSNQTDPLDPDLPLSDVVQDLCALVHIYPTQGTGRT